jgi:ribosomal protein L40E
MQKIMHAAPPLSTLRSDISKDVERAVMQALETDPNKRPASVREWIEELEKAAENVDDKTNVGSSRLVILAPIGAEVYVNDERKGSVGSSGRLVLSTVPAGQHILRVSKAGEKDDERVIEIREDTDEQVIQAQLKVLHGGSQPSPSQANSSGGVHSSMLPGIVACTICNSRFAEGVKFCGRCGNRSFSVISEGDDKQGFPCPRCSANLPASAKFCGRCGLNISQTGGLLIGKSNGLQSDIKQNASRQVEKICGRCGGRFPPTIKFCGRCGFDLH